VNSNPNDLDNIGEISFEELERRAALTVEYSEGIQPIHTIFYDFSIKYSAERALAAFELYDKFLKNKGGAEQLVGAVQEGVGHAGALSRYFWPSPNGKRNKQYELRMARGRRLREIYRVTDTSPLLNRDLRNAWEHFDEKLDIYILSHDAGYFFPAPMVGPHELADDNLGKIFKLIDVERGCLILLGKKFFSWRSAKK
jgi:hypothetical protein